MGTSRRTFLKTSVAGVAGLPLAVRAPESRAAVDADATRAVDMPVLVGESRTVIEANPDQPGAGGWFTNDHTFIEDKQGKLHWIGINNPFPPKGKQLYRYHPYLGHASTTDPLGTWARHGWAIDESKGSEYLGAPCVVWSPEVERYVMVVETWLDKRRLEVCYSDDLHTWERTRKPILADKLWYTTRDPHILRRPHGDYWIILTSFGVNGKKDSQIIRLVTRDFETFSSPEVILSVHNSRGSTMLESPCLVERGEWWYLFFTYAHRRYCETLVVTSRDPSRFDPAGDCLTSLFGHASKVFKYHGREYISSCGPEDHHAINTHGLTIAELRWLRFEN